MPDIILPDFPILPADLPTDWTWKQKVSPNGTELGKEIRYGYNYLMDMTNRLQIAANQLRDTAEFLSSKKAALASPTFTGTPTAPTAVQTVNNTQIATTAYVQTGLANKANASSPTIYNLPLASGFSVRDYTKSIYSKDAFGRITLIINVQTSNGSDTIGGPGGSLIATLPAGFRPPDMAYTPCYGHIMSGASGNVYLAQINTDGRIVVCSHGQPLAGAVFGTIVFTQTTSS